MTVLWVIIGVVLLMVIWAIVSANQGKTTQVRTEPTAPIAMPSFDPPERELPKVKHWQEAATAGVSKNFGQGGIPSGVSRDVGTANAVKPDEDIERLKKARAWEPRMTSTNTNADET